MAYYESCRSITGVAGSTIIAYRFVAFAADGFFDHVSSAQGDVDGIAGEAGVVTDALPVIVPDGGVAKVMAGEAIAVGALVASSNAGKAVAHGSAAGDVCMGRALTVATADGDIIAIQFLPKKVAAGS